MNDTVQSQLSYEDIRMLAKEDEDNPGQLSCTKDIYDDCMYKALESHMMKEAG